MNGREYTGESVIEKVRWRMCVKGCVGGCVSECIRECMGSDHKASDERMHGGRECVLKGVLERVC